MNSTSVDESAIDGAVARQSREASAKLDKNFCDWEGSAFGYGYGTGEQYTLPALKGFFDNLKPDGRTYDHDELAKALTPTVAWLLINVLCREDAIEYGTSPRYGWLTRKGERLKAYVDSHTADELYEIVMARTQDDCPCYKDICNCDDHDRCCPNPFWRDPK